MVLNGDGKSNILVRDSLKEVSANKNKWDIVVCNPPFGVRIVERSSDTIKKFDLGHKMELVNDDWQTTDEILKTQETGILFAELCVKLARPETGRIALVVPNGYLGNRSPKYHQLRSFLLRHTRIAAMVALPRFTFKGSGADVSASVIFLEKRAKPLARISDVESYDIAVQVIDRVGWNTGDKKGAPAYKRDPSDGTFVLDDDSDMILDSDFEGALRRLRLSDSNQDFEWFTKNIDGLDTVGHHDSDAWSVDSLEIVSDRYQTLDPKRLGKKFKDVVAVIEKVDHFRLGDVVDFVPERQFSDGQMLRIKPEQTYEYVELQNVEAGTYRSESLRGWELPQRAKHPAETGDFFVGGLWSSVRKWLLVGEVNGHTLVTNGMHRMRLKPEFEDRRLDIVAAFCSEAYRIQMRGLSRGSDGLAEICAEDVATIVVPVIHDEKVRAELQPFVDQLLRGFTTVEAKVSALLSANRLPLPDVAKRANHVMVV
jgi:type I restriction enzyme M protein